MSKREPTRAQLSTRLAYQDTVPSFIQAFKARASGQLPPEDSEYPVLVDEDEEWEDPGDGRPAIPRRPAIPERPKDGQWGSDIKKSELVDGDDDGRDDEAPLIVVLKEGKHLSAEDVENERRADKGLPPLPKRTETDDGSAPLNAPTSKPKVLEKTPMSFSSSKRTATTTGKKRRILGADDEQTEDIPARKKTKKGKKALLSFGDDYR